MRIKLKYKICKQCSKNKNSTHFRMRFCIRKSIKYYYRNNLCRQCERNNATEYHSAWKDDERYIKKNRERSKKALYDNKELYYEKHKKRRKTKAYKKWRKINYLKNKEKIDSQQKITRKRYSDYHRDNLTDHYVIGKIIQRTKLTKKQILKRPQLIEVWRLKMKINRIIKTKK